MATALILVPLVWAAVLAAVPSNRWRPWLLPIGSLAHLSLVVRAVQTDGISEYHNWLVLDDLGKVFLAVISVMHVLCMFYAPGYLNLRPERSNRVLCSCLQISLSVMSLVVLAHHLGLMWVAVEATTLASAPSIYFNHNPRSIEATWKYLLICSVGIAIALLGSFFLAYSELYELGHATLQFEDLVKNASLLSKPWLHAAFVLLLVGYGTKMGLAPMHTWKPDAYGEAPGLVGALLAGGVTNCAFFAILRIYHIVAAAGDGDYARRMMIFMGLLSMATGAVFMIRQRDFKRLLAYSSVEHMGILVFGVGIGGQALFGSLLHVVNNAMTKGVLFLSAGNIHRAYKSKSTTDVHGAYSTLPLSSTLLVAGFMAGCGSPPFGPFVSEFTILTTAIGEQHYWAAGLFLLLLMLAFVGMGTCVLPLVFGRPTNPDTPFRDGLLTGAPVLVFMAIVLMLGLYIPPPVKELLDNAVQFLQRSVP
jgi:hydrogenase-4 component F